MPNGERCCRELQQIADENRTASMSCENLTMFNDAHRPEVARRWSWSDGATAQRDTKLVIESVLITEIGGHQSRKLLQEQSSLELRGGDGVSADIPESLPSTLPPGLSLPSPAVVESIAAGAKFNSSDFNLTGLVNGSLDEAAARDALTNLAANPSVFGGNSTNGSLSLDGLADMDFSTTQETKPFERLAENQTDRPDPRNKFRKYTGGWDFRNASYLSSVAYTAAPAFIIAVLWALLAVVYLFAIICYCCCCKRNRHAKFYESSAYCWPLVLVVLLTFTALGGSAILYTGAGKMHTELGLTIDYILEEVNKTTTKVRLAADDLVSMTNFSIAGAQMTSADQVKVMDAMNEMYKAANDVDTAVEDNKKDIRRVVDLIRLIMNIVVGVTAGLVILGLVFTLLAWKYCIRVLAILGWVLIFVTWVLAGVYIVVMNVTDDTCLAMEEWTHDVSANTSISDILPCVDKNTANRTLLKSKSVVLFGTQLINNGIVVTNSLPVLAPAVPLLCPPYTNDLQVVPIETCLAQEPERTNFVEYEEDWRKHTCPLSPDYLSACQQPEPSMNCFFSNCSDRRLTVPTYLKLVESTWMLVKINSTTHMLVELMQCQFAVKIFTDVNNNFCHKLQVQAKLQWIGLIVLSSSSMLLVFLWQLYVHRWNKRMRTTSKPIYDSHAQSYG
ncbi:hypothetical protein CBR_g29327 [Chara braunii]|uniref:Transmembrane protein n=1 Tax=Chara braunii TaxID=69332 RepID=A0A388JWI6_CHABU|nr:hypothetical protein CBR_g29327 [Chara braunii]|eukprot:GBG62127.1 hypothetical protein CBR_g29327 [Chara braunii]